MIHDVLCVCYCAHCQKRWQEEVGGEMPRTVDWTDPRWVRLQRKREEWLGEFAAICTGTVKQFKPHATVEHQSSIYPGSWNNGASWPLVAANDFLQGDFYGDALQGSFVRKMLEDLTPNRPFGYETSYQTSFHPGLGVFAGIGGVPDCYASGPARADLPRQRRPHGFLLVGR